MIQFPRILCPVDLSDASQVALQSALMLARWYESAVTVLHIVHVAIPPAPFSSQQPVALTPAQHTETSEHVERFIAAANPGDVPVTVTIVQGPAVAEILTAAHDLPASLVVMGTHGRSGFEHLLMGSITERVLRKASCPVCTVRPDLSRLPDTPPAPFRRILCGVDFSPASLNAMQHALSLAQESGGELTLVHALDWPMDVQQSEMFGPDAAHYQKLLSERASRELAAAVPEEARTWCQIEEAVAMGRPYELILDTAEKHGADLIVVGAHSRLSLDRHFLGSTTDHVIRAAKCPVLTVRR